ncbi:MAG TPA: hypothetical protein VGI79_11375 [Caulobacteraceae bacterium]|jgi:hypothetical protein
MTRLPVTYPPAPERRERLMTRALRLVWTLLCWIAAFSIALLAWAKIER